ncbi:MAG: phosphate ABC transporter substrate-binding protein PstS [Candidatus Delongbacteria bacterium]|jgi:phosphate transport system substrate-binding protein|nr:phosphate ABC transporter substrate-binding protein PstS [Candidatus Delongbacteria bacterium]
MRFAKRMTAALIITAAAVTAFAQKIEVIGAGASFPAPLVTAMADQYRTLTDGRVTVNYQSIGSGGGIRQFGEQTIMFGMTEAFLKDEIVEEVEKKTGGRAFNMPITLADVVVTYNVPGVKDGVVFNGEVLADIFLGKIKKWNDKNIQALNKSIKLPNLNITVVHRSDGSGTTNIWTSYLTKVSKEWADKIGYATSVNWPVGVGAKGNEGVAGVVMNTPGALGYNSYAYALLNKISYGYLINKSGNTIKPNFEATSEAANIDLPEDTRIIFTDTPAAQGYPVAGFTWMLVYENLEKNKAIKSKNEAEELIKFLIWAITDGQGLSERLGYAKLPKAAIEKNKAMIRELKWNGEEIGKKILG